MTSKRERSLLSTMNDHLRPENTVIAKELGSNLKNNSLEPMLFKRVDSIRLS